MREPGEAPHAEDRALLVRAAEEAGRVALAHFRQPVAVRDKPGGAGPVSDADLAVNALLTERLRAARPAYGWLSEEDHDTPDARRARRRVFVVDPIDGTRAFLEGQDGFSVAVAVLDEETPVAAAVHLPARGITYAAHLGGGATVDGAPIAVSGRAEPDGARAVGRRSQFAPKFWPGGAPDIEPVWRSSLAWRLCLVADGATDLALTFRACWEWDIAAGALIAAEAGATVSDADGLPLVFNSAEARLPGVMVAPPTLHAALLARRRVGQERSR